MTIAELIAKLETMPQHYHIEMMPEELWISAPILNIETEHENSKAVLLSE